MFALYLAEEKVRLEVVEPMRTWAHRGFSVVGAYPPPTEPALSWPATGRQRAVERVENRLLACVLRHQQRAVNLADVAAAAGQHCADEFFAQ